MNTSHSDEIKPYVYSPGELVYVAGEMFILGDLIRGDWDTVMFAHGQLGLIIDVSPTGLLVWFAKLNTSKKEENIYACAPLYKQTTKVWLANSAMTSLGAEEFLSS